MKLARAAIAGAAIAVIIEGGPYWLVRVEASRCRDAYSAERWDDAATHCGVAVEGGGPPELILMAAQALGAENKDRDAIAMAERGFDTTVDATAHRVAGEERIGFHEYHEADQQLALALHGHLSVGDHREAARDAYLLTQSRVHQRNLGDALDAATIFLREAKLANDLQFIGLAYRAQTKVLTEIGDANAAREALIEAASALSESPDYMPWILFTHGVLVLELGDPVVAVDLLTKALVAAERIKLPSAVTGAHLNLAKAEQELHHPDEAERHLAALPPPERSAPAAGYVAALIAVERKDTKAATTLLAAAAANAANDDYAADIAYQQGVLAEASDDVKAAQAFYRASIKLVEDMRPHAGAPELRTWMLARRRAPYEALFVLLARHGSKGEALEAAELLHARTWLDVVVTATAPRARISLQALQTAAPLDTGQILAAIDDREVLIYVTARGALWRLRVEGKQAGRPPIIEIAELGGDLDESLASWRAHPDQLELADQLGQRLLPETVADPARPLYIVATDRLADVPFAALRRAHRYLSADRPLVRLPGVAALTCRPHAPALDPPVLLADAQNNLSGARDEVKHAAGIVGGDTYLGDQATIARATSAHRARLFHAAVHALIGGGGGALALADGNLTTDEIITRQIQPRVAVLAGCKTGVSEDQEGWGALPSALLVAGTQTVVATLRVVEDADAAAVMKAFYEAGGAEHPVLALAAAQRKLAAAHAPPHVWAWFAAWGQAEPDACDHVAR